MHPTPTLLAGARLRYRHLGRDSSHRIALLRNLVTSLIEHETIVTTWPKAKEAQRFAEKAISLAKRGSDEARRRCMAQIFDNPQQHILNKLFGPLAERFRDRPGGYTRVMRVEPKNKADQAPSAILELVDGPCDMKFAMVATTIARCVREGKELSPITMENIQKVTQFRKDGDVELQRMVDRMSRLHKEHEQEHEQEQGQHGQHEQGQHGQQEEASRN